MKTTFALAGTVVALALSACTPNATTTAPPTASSAATPARDHQTAAAPAPAVAVAWFNGTLDSAFEKAKFENKPVFVFWGAAWCPYCQALKATVFKRPDFVEQSTHVIAVDLDGDQPDAQKAGTAFKVIGYPTLILFRPDRTEITRVSGGMDLEQYASVIKHTLQDERPIAEVLAAATNAPSANSTQITSADCRRLAYHAWDLEPDAESPPPDRAQRLTIAAERCPAVEHVARARLTAQVLAMALRAEAQPLQTGAPPSATLTARISTTLMPILMDPTLVRGTADILASFDDALYIAVKAQGPAQTEEFRKLWVNALQFASHDTHYGESERLLSLATALNAEQQLRPDHTVPDNMAREAREQTRTALSTTTQATNRHDVINAARMIYSVLGDDTALYDMLIAELPKTKTPYYYMPTLASIKEKQGNKEEALSWLEMAYTATDSPGGKAKWGTTYLSGLIRLKPEDTRTIESVANAVADAIRERDAQLPNSPTRSKRFTDILKKWATTSQRRTIAITAIKRLSA